ncbi:MAG: ketose-bisphosphate aldolase [Clostridia bacterium]
MIVNLASVLEDAKKQNYAVGSFNIYNYETIKGVIESAKESRIPAIIAFGEQYLKNMDFATVYAIVRSLTEDTDIPIVLHLDHCKSLENIFKAIRAGFTSVMYDGSALSFRENLNNTKKIVEVAHATGVSVEAELGCLAGGEGSNEGSGHEQEIYTNAAQAEEFVKATGIDALAVSIGTVHGMYKGEPKINIEVLKQIASRIELPLVLHGGSGTPEAVIKECIKNGICKINVNTEISVYTVEKIKELLNGEKSSHLSVLSLKEIEYIKTVVKRYMLLFFVKMSQI